VKRLYAWLAGIAGGAAVYRAFRRQPSVTPAVAPPVAPPAVGPDPADELKAKLAEARSGGEAPATGAAPDSDVEARRRSVHEQARSAIDEMQGSDPT
jgi:hypothetical protein